MSKGDKEGAVEELDRLFDFAYFMSGYTKPLIVSINGKVKNSAIPVYSNIPLSYLRNDVEFHFNSIDFNSVLHCGESHMLSKLPNELGTYIALTGSTLTEGDILKLNMVEEKREFSQEDFFKLSELTKQAFDFIDFDNAYEPVYKHNLSKKADVNKMIIEFYERTIDEKEGNVLFDLFYRKKMIENANLVNEIKNDPDLRYSIDSEEQRAFSLLDNNLKTFKTMFLDPGKEDELLEEPYAEHYNNRFKIAELFCFNSVDEIFEALENDTSDFAAMTLSQLRGKSKSILELNLKLIRKTRNMAYSECLMQEYTILKNMMLNKKLAPVLFKKGKSDVQLTEEELDRIVEGELTYSSPISPSDMMPVKDYFNSYPEAFICYMSGAYSSNPELMKNFEKVVKANLTRLGVDYLGSGFHKEFVKDKLKQYELWMRKLKFKSEKIEEMAVNENLSRKYLKEREKQIEDFCKEDKFSENLEMAIGKVLDSYIEENLVTMQDSFNRLEQLNKPKYATMIRNILATGRFSDKMNSTDNMANDQLFLEIGDRPGELSKDFKRFIDNNKLQQKYKRSIKIKKSQINDYIKGKVKDFDVELKELNDDDISIDMRSLNYTDFDTEDKKRKQFLNFANHISENGMIEKEELYRIDFINKIIDTSVDKYKEFSEDTRKELFEQFYLKIYGERLEHKTHLELLNMLDNGTFTFKMNPLYKEIKVDLINDIPKEKKSKIHFHDINEKALDEIIDMNYLFRNQPGIDKSYEDLKEGRVFEFLSSFDNLTDNERKAFKLIEELNSHPFFSNIQTEIMDLVNSAVKEFDFEQPNPKNGSIMLKDITIQLKLEFMNFILPHIAYNSSLHILDSFEKLHQGLSLERGKLTTDIGKILLENGINVTDKTDQNSILEQLDFIFFSAVELFENYQDRVTLPKDIIKRDFSRFMAYLKDAELMILEFNSNVPDVNFREFIDIVKNKKERDSERINQIDPTNSFEQLEDLILPAEKVNLQRRFNQDYIDEILERTKKDKFKKLNKGFFDFFMNAPDEWKEQNEFTEVKDPLKDLSWLGLDGKGGEDYEENKALLKEALLENNSESDIEEALNENQNTSEKQNEDNEDNENNEVEVEEEEEVQEEEMKVERRPKRRKKNKKVEEAKVPEIEMTDEQRVEAEKFKKQFLGDMKSEDFDTEELEKISAYDAFELEDMMEEDKGHRFDSESDSEDTRRDITKDDIDSELGLINQFKMLMGDNSITSYSIVDKLKNNYTHIRKAIIGSGLLPEIDNHFSFLDYELEQQEKQVNPNNIGPIRELQLTLESYIKGENSCMAAYYRNMNKENTAIPDSFTELDHRQSAKEWFDLQLVLVLRKILATRRKVEPFVDRSTLNSIDSILAKQLTPTKLRSALLEALEIEKNSLSFYKDSIIAAKDDLSANVINAEKIDNKLINPDFTIKNEEAIKQALAISLSIKGQRHLESMEHVRAYSFVGDLMEKAKNEPEKLPDHKERNYLDIEEDKAGDSDLKMGDVIKVSLDKFKEMGFEREMKNKELDDVFEELNTKMDN